MLPADGKDTCVVVVHWRYTYQRILMFKICEVSITVTNFWSDIRGCKGKRKENEPAVFVHDNVFCNVQECWIITTDLSLFCNVQKCCIITTDLSPKLLSIRTFCSNLYTRYKAYSIVVCCQFATSKGTGFLHVQSQILDSVKRQVFTDRSLKEVWSATRVFLLSFVRLSTVIITEGCWGGGGGLKVRSDPIFCVLLA